MEGSGTKGVGGGIGGGEVEARAWRWRYEEGRGRRRDDIERGGGLLMIIVESGSSCGVLLSVRDVRGPNLVIYRSLCSPTLACQRTSNIWTFFVL